MAAVTVAVVLLAWVWLPRLWFWAGWRRTARTAVTYRLTPLGERPDRLEDVGWEISGALTELGNRRRRGLVAHRFRDGDGVAAAVTVYGYPDPDRIAKLVGQAVGARTARDPDLELPSAGRVWYGRRYDFQGRDPHAHADPDLAGPAEFITDVLVGTDGPACVSIGLEPTRRWEARELRDWHNTRAGRRDDMEGTGPGRSVRSQWVAFTPDDSIGSQAVSGLPAQLHRWPFVMRARLATSLRSYAATGAALLAGPLIGGGADVAAAFAAIGAAGWLDAAGAPIRTIAAAGVAGSLADVALLAAGAACLLCALVSWRLALPVNRAQHRWRRLHHQHHLVPVERPWMLSPVRLVRWLVARFNPRDVNVRLEGNQSTHAYPYRVRTIGLNAHQAAQLLALPGQADTAGVRTEAAAVDAPAEVVAAGRAASPADGSVIADDPQGRPVALPDGDRKSGVFVSGDQGSGKSYAVLRCWREDAAARLSRARRDGRMTMIWFETKGEGADEAERALACAGYRASRYVRLDALADAGPRLELLNRGEPELAAGRLVGAFTYAFETGAVGPRAAEAMRSAFTLALHVTPEVAEAAGLGRRTPNVLWVGILLMGGDPASGVRGQLLDAVTRAAADDLTRRGGRPPTALRGHNATLAELEARGDGALDDLEEASQAARSPSPLFDALRGWLYYERMDKRSFTDLFESPRNKLAAVAQVDPLWTPAAGREDIRLHQLIEWHGAAILNFGSSQWGRLDQQVSNRLAAVTLYLLWEEAKQRCHGWLAGGRSLGLYADELSHLSGTGSGSDVIGEMLDQGRAFGVQLCLATQRFAQLPQRTAEAALSFGTRLYMKTENIDNADRAAVDLTGGRDGAFSARDLRSLPVGVAAMRLTLEGASHAPFTATVRHPFADGEPTGRADAAAADAAAADA